MELAKKIIHTERLKSKSLLQVPLEEDINVSDTKPDVEKIIYTDGAVKIDEIKTGMNKIWVKGKLCYQVLYQADGTQGELAGMEGSLPFMEEIYIDKIESQDRVVCKASVEDLRTHIINSRKLSVQSVISFEPKVEETVTHELCTDLSDNNTDNNISKQLEYRKKSVDYLETVVKKRDLLRIHEETKLPSGMPEIETVLWKSMGINNVTFRPMDDKLAVSGDINVFVVYQENNTGKNNWYETTISFSGDVECQNSRDTMIADIGYDIGHEEISVREDSDGESRIIGIESTLEMEIKLYEKENTQIVSDVYGVSCEVQASTDEKQFRSLLADISFEEKISKNIKLDINEPKILQICHSSAKVFIEEVLFAQDTVKLRGEVFVQSLYISSDDEGGFNLIKETIPFETSKAITDLTNAEIENYSMLVQAGSPTVSIKDGSQIEVKVNIDINMIIYNEKRQAILTALETSPINPEILEKLPGFVIYYVKQGDSLWQIGKKYYVSVDKIKEVNNLATDEIKAGDRLLIVK